MKQWCFIGIQWDFRKNFMGFDRNENGMGCYRAEMFFFTNLYNCDLTNNNGNIMGMEWGYNKIYPLAV